MKKQIHITETAGINRTGEYIRVAVPCARGEVRPGEPLAIIDASGQAQSCQARVLKQWPDRSVKWLLVDCAATVPAGSETIWVVMRAGTPLINTAAVQVRQGADIWEVDSGAGVFSIDARVFRPFASIKRRGIEVLGTAGGSCLLGLNGKSSCLPVVEEIGLEDNGPLRAIVRVAGRFVMPERGEPLRFCSRMHFFAGNMAVRFEFTIHNPKAAGHPKGLWDLGDPRSTLFKELAFVFSFAPGTVTEIHVRPETGAPPIVKTADTGLAIYQESSGGKNWQSPNHRNREGRVPFTRKGYVIEADGSGCGEGLRANPLVWCGSGAVGVAVAVPHFWQEFPKAIEADGDQLKVSLFPAQFPDLHELQGGEQKTHEFLLDFAAGTESLAWSLVPLQVAASPSDYRSSGIFHDLPGEEDLLDRFSTAGEILLKREVIDEYGWRNFGELYADHEAVNHQEDTPFISHYNNQYDFCAGAYRKYFTTGNLKWGELAADLARHVWDIDVYHTEGDREEYNNGLFWHTDHYIDAGLSGHRSFSREHLRSKEPSNCGGGPGPEHCYTTGFLLHYFQTGNPVFRQAVLSLADWVLLSLEGAQTLLAALKRGAGYMSLWRASRGKLRPFPRYPLTRGTGNAITACLDAFEACGERRYLFAAERLIRGALHPDDDIQGRDLLNAETAWSYTVLLAAVAKFLDQKLELEELDSAFMYARASLLAYAEWMLIHEYPYLEKPEILQYPNETWAAQDIRKSVIFLQAARHADPCRREALRQKGIYFLETARNELLRHATSRLSRPVALMLQNGWAGSLLNHVSPTDAGIVFEEAPTGHPTPCLTFRNLFARCLSEMSGALRQSSLRREWEWLMVRLTN